MILGLSMLFLSRFQFAITIIFHYFFVTLSIGLAVIISIMETIYVIKGNDIYQKMTKFWGKIFIFSFVVGVVTGLIQEFQFGMNWSEYSRFMGDIFGAPLAIEALAAFYLESMFIGMWMFTWERFNKIVHCSFIWITMLGSILSAFWILSANSFMQNPVGYFMNSYMHHVRMTSFWAIISNRQLWNEFPHVIFGAILTGSFVVAGCSAWRLLKKEHIIFYRKSINIALVVALVAGMGSIISGDAQTRYQLNNQPMKFAAMEGLSKNSTNRGNWATFAYSNPRTHTTKTYVNVPYVLNLLSFHKLTGKIKGSQTVNKELQAKYKKNGIKNYYVPENTLFYSFRIMAISAMLLTLVAIIGLWFNRKKSQLIITQKWFLYILGLCLWIPFIVNTAGWLVTELGRYPWAVYGLLTVADAVSPTSTIPSLLFTNVVYFMLFTVLGLTMIHLSHRTLKSGPQTTNDDIYAPDTNINKPKDPYQFDESEGKSKD